MTHLDLAALRDEYMRERLDESHVAADPFVQCQRWFDEAFRAKLPMANAMTLATAAADGQPAARMVLLKGMDTRGFVFYTDYDSRKGRELAANPRAALLFYWIELERELRIEGVVEKTSAAESDAYFASRPRGSRLAAIASRQSSTLTDRAALEQRYDEAADRYAGEPPRPARWGGFLVVPHALEFWQGRPNRLHDRLLYQRGAEGWTLTRLSP